MRTLATVLLAGALSTTAIFAGAIPRTDAATKKPAPQLPFRPDPKRPVGTTAPRIEGATVATPTLPFRLYQKRPSGRATTPNPIEAFNRK